MGEATGHPGSAGARATTEQSGTVRRTVTQTYHRPGSALIYKGEPSATELNMLRSGLKPEDMTEVLSIVSAIMERG
jgi:hypothetical protein